MRGKPARVDEILTKIRRFGPITTVQLSRIVDMEQQSLAKLLKKCKEVRGIPGSQKCFPTTWEYVGESA